MDDVYAWRRAQRQELITARQAAPDTTRHAQGAAVGALLEQAFALPADKVIAFCWPYRGEVDVRFAIRRLREAGALAALPVVAAKARPLQFRRWWPGVAMTAGALGIPAPLGTDLVTPDAAFVPLVGFDAEGYRLGYGGGYFDRTLAALPRKPLTIGVGYEASRLATIQPQPHDIAMDFIVTEAGIHVVAAGGLEVAAPGAAAGIFTRLARDRGLW
jgi:5,10-methenyltetrahydrofolate synthetase